MSLLKHLSVFIALYCGFYQYGLFTILVVSVLILALQLSEFKDFALDEIKVYSNELIPRFKSVLFICLPTVAFVSFLYFIGVSMFNIMQM